MVCRRRIYSLVLLVLVYDLNTVLILLFSRVVAEIGEVSVHCHDCGGGRVS